MPYGGKEIFRPKNWSSGANEVRDGSNRTEWPKRTAERQSEQLHENKEQSKKPKQAKKGKHRKSKKGYKSVWVFLTRFVVDCTDMCGVVQGMLGLASKWPAWKPVTSKEEKEEDGGGALDPNPRVRVRVWVWASVWVWVLTMCMFMRCSAALQVTHERADI